MRFQMCIIDETLTDVWSRYIRYRNGATLRISKNVNICSTPSRWASPLVLWVICSPHVGLICSPPPLHTDACTQHFYADSIHFSCMLHSRGGGGRGGASAGELMALQEQQGDGGTSKFRRIECNEGDDADSNVPTRPDPPAS